MIYLYSERIFSIGEYFHYFLYNNEIIEKWSNVLYKTGVMDAHLRYCLNEMPFVDISIPNKRKYRISGNGSVEEIVDYIALKLALEL